MSKLKVFTARRVRTMDAGRPIAEAIAVKDGRIVSVGTLESMRPWLEREPYEIDDSFRDKVIFPGFIDPHTHFRMSGVYMGLTYLGPIDQQGPRGFSKGLRTRDDVLDKLREVDRSLADPTEPIIAWGLDPPVCFERKVSSAWRRSQIASGSSSSLGGVGAGNVQPTHRSVSRIWSLSGSQLP